MVRYADDKNSAENVFIVFKNALVHTRTHTHAHTHTLTLQ